MLKSFWVSTFKCICIFSQKSWREKNNIQVRSRVARRYNFEPKIPIWVNFERPWNGRVCYDLWLFGIYYGHLVHFVKFGTFSPILVYCVKKNLATLVRSVVAYLLTFQKFSLCYQAILPNTFLKCIPTFPSD
jgi:hypothetical protein